MHVGKALPNHAAAPHPAFDRKEIFPSHQRQSHHRYYENRRVDDEHPARPQHRNEHPRQGGTNEAGNVESHRVQPHRVGQAVRRDQLRDESLPLRNRQGIKNAGHERDEVNLKQLS